MNLPRASLFEQDARHVLRSHHLVDRAGIDRHPGHAVELSALGVLHDDEAARLLDVEDTSRAIAAAARQDDRDRAIAAVLRQRAEEGVDGQCALLLAILLAQQQAPAGDDHLHLRRDQVHMVRLDVHAVLHEMNRERGVPGEQLVHHALEVRRQVLDDHERHPGVARQAVEESLDGVEAAGRRADADDVRRSW